MCNSRYVSIELGASCTKTRFRNNTDETTTVDLVDMGADYTEASRSTPNYIERNNDTLLRNIITTILCCYVVGSDIFFFF